MCCYDIPFVIIQKRTESVRVCFGRVYCAHVDAKGKVTRWRFARLTTSFQPRTPTSCAPPNNMKVYLHYNEGEPKLTIKVKLPKKWRAGPTDNLKDCVVDNYNKKHASGGEDSVPPLDKSFFHLELESGKELMSDAIVDTCVTDCADVYLKPGPSKTLADVKVEEAKKLEIKKEKQSKLISCKNFGCQASFDPAENHETACTFHAAPPIFHETNKWWSCCPHKKGYDWESFQAIKGCKVGPHLAEKAGPKFLGGTDLREKSANEFAPKRMEGGAETTEAMPAAPSTASSNNGTGKIVTPLEKLLNLRKAMISIGIPGSEFDRARDVIKTKHESDGADVWNTVCTKLAEHFGESLKNIE